MTEVVIHTFSLDDYEYTEEEEAMEAAVLASRLAENQAVDYAVETEETINDY